MFYERLRALLRIVIPEVKSREAGLLAIHTSFLVFRTMLSLYVADLDGKSVLSVLCATTCDRIGNLPDY